MQSKVEKISKYNGYDYIIIIGQLGFRCGYIRIPKKSKIYGLEYFENNIVLNGASVEDKFSVHGGITFTGHLSAEITGFDETEWFVGFDCGHHGDAPEIKTKYSFYMQGVVRSMLFVEKELTNLIDQIIEFEGE